MQSSVRAKPEMAGVLLRSVPESIWPAEVEKEEGGVIEVDRSRIVAFQRCPRERFLAYHAGGKGLQRRAKALPLQFGSAFHEGTEVLLTGGGIESAVLRSNLFLSAAFAGASIELEESAQAEYSKAEQGALAEALLRGWWAWEGESFLEQFEVIECEQEGRANLTTIEDQPYLAGNNEIVREDVVLMFRPDALVRERLSGDLYVVSWKTAATYTKRTLDQCRHDMQSMSEVWGLTQVGSREVATSESQQRPASEQAKCAASVKIEGVLYKFALKGKRDKDDWDGLYKQNSHLIYGWKRLGPGEGDDDWAWCFKWETEEINEKTGRPKGTTLGKGWKKVPIWQEYPGGVRAWIEDLAKNQIAPRHISALGAVFPQSLPVERRADEVERWKRQIVRQEQQIAKHVDLCASVRDDDPEGHAELLDTYFPQYSHSCESYSGCSFRDICWSGVAVEEGELYQIRVANHPEAEDENGSDA